MMTHTETTALAAQVTREILNFTYLGSHVRVTHCQDQVRFHVTSGSWAGQWVAIQIIGRHSRTAAIVVSSIPPVGPDQYSERLASCAALAVQASAERLA